MNVIAGKKICGRICNKRSEPANWEEVQVEDSDLARLFRAGLAGDERAYGDFLHAAAELVRAWARRRTAFGGLDPEDIVQETLLAIHVKRHTWRADGPVAPWLYAIAKHKLVDALRRMGRHPRVEISELEGQLAVEEAESVRGWEIERALEMLTPGQRSVVTAISVEGRTIGEAARSLHMNETAVRVALHRGLAAIARRFGRD
ncbi:sigma-70 family RNA polymerase sigma factor [Ensifer sp. BR816]|uniref:sigma-70 family RNA polymerase sigma factor n=1 Tax=Rhizobium sp. (strain BR816) TaxID=1057002 RepID=UPI00037437F1